MITKKTLAKALALVLSVWIAKFFISPVAYFEKRNFEAKYKDLPFTFADCIVNIHAHNDYKTSMPLFEALAAGAKGLEVDVFRLHNELYVGHNAFELEFSRTLDSMYLKPLFDLLATHKHSYSKEQPLLLFIDLKTSNSITAELLEKQLEPYRKFLVYPDLLNPPQAYVKIVVTGFLPNENIEHKKFKYLFFDDRIHRLYSNSKDTQTLYPVLSMKWTSRESVESYAGIARGKNQLFRIWGLPKSFQSVDKQIELGATLINSDNVFADARLLRQRTIVTSPILTTPCPNKDSR